MTNPAATPDLPPATAPATRKNGHPILAWHTILDFVVLILWHSWRSPLAEAGHRGGETVRLPFPPAMTA
jgi:hypothetical protein